MSDLETRRNENNYLSKEALFLKENLHDLWLNIDNFIKERVISEGPGYNYGINQMVKAVLRCNKLKETFTENSYQKEIYYNNYIKWSTPSRDNSMLLTDFGMVFYSTCKQLDIDKKDFETKLNFTIK